MESEEHLRAFLRLTHRWVDPGFEVLWEEIGQRPGDPDGPDQPDVFFDETGGLWPSFYDWLLHGLLVRDAVSAFEIYLEKVTDEVLRSQRLEWSAEDGRYVEWDALKWFWRTHMGLKVETNRIKKIRKMRNILTHQRGELRTDDLRRRFGGGDDLLPDDAIRLSEQDVLAVFDDLAAMVEKVDTAARDFLGGTGRLEVKKSKSGAGKVAEAAHEDRIPFDLLELITDSLAGWDERGPTADDDLAAGEQIASAVRALLSWHSNGS